MRTITPIWSLARSSDDSAILATIIEPDCNLAIWQRDPPPGMDQLARRLTTNLRLQAPVRDIPALVQAALAEQSDDNLGAWELLIEDVRMLSALFADSLDLGSVHLRLEAVETNSCCKFHADYVRARLITTYAGQGTQWLDAPGLDEIADTGEAHSIEQLATGDVGLFRGRLAEGEPAIHRSPPIAGTGERRLLLVIDAPVADE